MERRIYNEDHEAFRSSVREFMRREVVPHVDEHAENVDGSRVRCGSRLAQPGFSDSRSPRSTAVRQQATTATTRC